MHFLAFMLQSNLNPEDTQRFVLALLAFIPILIAIGIAILVIPFWFICKKAGFSPWLSLLNIIPFGNLVLIYVLAFADWKVAPLPPAYWPPQAFPPQPPPPPQA
jgi:hypothetical protein